MFNKIIDWFFNTTIGGIVFTIVIPTCIMALLSVTNGDEKRIWNEKDE